MLVTVEKERVRCKGKEEGLWDCVSGGGVSGGGLYQILTVDITVWLIVQ